MVELKMEMVMLIGLQGSGKSIRYPSLSSSSGMREAYQPMIQMARDASKWLIF